MEKKFQVRKSLRSDINRMQSVVQIVNSWIPLCQKIALNWFNERVRWVRSSLTSEELSRMNHLNHLKLKSWILVSKKLFSELLKSLRSLVKKLNYFFLGEQHLTNIQRLPFTELVEQCSEQGKYSKTSTQWLSAEFLRSIRRLDELAKAFQIKLVKRFR